MVLIDAIEGSQMDLLPVPPSLEDFNEKFEEKFEEDEDKYKDEGGYGEAEAAAGGGGAVVFFRTDKEGSF